MADKLVQQNFNEIIIDDGSVKVPIRNKHGEQIGEFSFRPTDIGIVDRFNSVAAEFDKIVEPLESVNIKPDGTVDEQNEAEFAALREAEKRLYAACDRLFGGGVLRQDAPVFPHQRPFLLRKRAVCGRCLYLPPVRPRGEESQLPC